MNTIKSKRGEKRPTESQELIVLKRIFNSRKKFVERCKRPQHQDCTQREVSSSEAEGSEVRAASMGILR